MRLVQKKKEEKKKDNLPHRYQALEMFRAWNILIAHLHQIFVQQKNKQTKKKS